MFTALFWKKIWAWIKHYWYWPVIIVLMVLSMAMCGRGSAPQKLLALLANSKENYKKELEVVKTNNKEKDENKERIIKEHAAEIKNIEATHNIKVDELEIEKQKELAKTIEKNKDKPDELAEDIAKILSAELIKNG
jgi:hypothetical protein